MKESYKTKLAFFEKIIIVFVIVLMIIGVVGAFVNVQWFENSYAQEDGLIEWLTIVALVIAIVVAIRYLVQLSSKRSWLFFLCVSFIALAAFFFGGEELSWGQRIFHIQTPEYFKEHNAQDETNLHNLVMAGK